MIPQFLLQSITPGALLAASTSARLWPTFEKPVWLALIPPLCLLSWWIARRSLAGGSAYRQMIQLAVRCIVIALLCGALAEPRLRWRANDVAVVTVMDVSDSVPAAEQKRTDKFLNASLAQRPKDDRFGLVTVAQDAFVQSIPSTSITQVDKATIGRGDASAVQKGLDLARALIPADAAGRILLISDGNETSGSLRTAATALAAAGVPIDVAPVTYDRSGMVRIEDLVVPAWVRDGDTITARIIFNAGQPVRGRLTLLLNGEAIDLDPQSPQLSARLDLPAGLRVVSQTLRLPSGPSQRLEAVFEPDDPSIAAPQLLKAEGVTFTSDTGRVLILAEDPDAAAPLIAAMADPSVKIDVRPAAGAPTDLTEWTGYDAVVLYDEPAYGFSQAQQQDLASAVHDGGIGLLMVGGPQAFGAGGWIGSPLADSLPVLLDPPPKRNMPMGALALIIDRSGSMASPAVLGGISRQEVANEAAILGVKALSRLDQVAVIAFSSDTEVILPLTPCSDPQAIARQIRAIGSMGGTDLFPAIDVAGQQLAKSPAGVRHIIILTDGQTEGNPEDGYAAVRELKRRGTSVSTISIGDANNELLKKLASLGGGRNYDVRSENARAVLPQIFIKEAQTLTRSLIWEGAPFSPKLEYAGDSLRGMRGPFPATSGYIVTADRGGLSTIILRGPQSDPILAQWQHGLGRVTAYTSDASTRWNTAWTGWTNYQAFWRQQLGWVLRPSGDTRTRVTVENRGDKARISLDMHDAAGERLNFATIRARVTAPTGERGENKASDVSFRQVGPGRYEAEVDAAATGAHMLSIRYDTPGTEGEEPRSGSVRAAIIKRSGDELRESTPNQTLLRDIAQRTNGHIYELDSAGANLWLRDNITMPESSRPIWLLAAMIGMGAFLFDVAARRITIDPSRLRSRWLRLWSSPTSTVPASLATLATVKSRAAASMAQKPSATSFAPPPDPDIIPLEPSADAPPAPPIFSPASPPPAPQPPATGGDMMSRLRDAKKRSQRDQQ